ncbi:unnamed protein product [Staurois parvus]|uniref:Uncharacterized protein n=1 Tax=Staurois parvus TaxID=386267 RepID=A0ABN9E0U8_9NEOB|nr:unnamed protein product [Staurois parvus]
MVKKKTTGTLYSIVMRPRYMFLELMASKLYGVPKVKSTKKNAWCLQ